MRIEHLPSLNHKVRSVVAMELTAEKLGRGSFKADDTVLLHSTLLTHGHAYQMEWNGSCGSLIDDKEEDSQARQG